MERYYNLRKKTQLTSFAISIAIFAIAIYGIATKNEQYFEIGLILVGAVSIGGIILATVLGRFWCGWLCPRGTFLDHILNKISRNHNIPAPLKTTPFKLLMLTVIMLMFAATFTSRNPLLQTTNKLALLGGFLIFVCIATTIILSIPLGILYKPRTWCTFCPMGFAQSLMAATKILHITPQDCKNCKNCTSAEACPIEVFNTKKHTTEDTNCINCLNCADACRFNAIKPVITQPSAKPTPTTTKNN
jgi:polyferredoxin